MHCIMQKIKINQVNYNIIFYQSYKSRLKQMMQLSKQSLKMQLFKDDCYKLQH